jgi:SAM-dependent methyltransferase
LDHADHVALLAPAVARSADAVWADIGAGSGAFTLALADLLGPGARIITVDRDRSALAANARAVAAAFPDTRLTSLVADFREPLDLPHLDGLLAANSLHFVPRGGQVALISSLAAHLRPTGTFVVVEYDADSGNPWVPHPFSASSWPRVAQAAGLVDGAVVGRVPSRFLGAIYSARATRAQD